MKENPVVDKLVEIVEKYGGVKKINEAAILTTEAGCAGLVKELGPRIRVNAVTTGVIETPLHVNPLTEFDVLGIILQIVKL